MPPELPSAFSPIRFGLTGFGRVAPTHADAIRHLGGEAVIAAVCDHNPEALDRAKEATGAKGYAVLADMLQDPELDVVSICTPSGVHAEHGKQAARAGKHVLVEKPMDVSVEAAQSLIDCCQSEGVELFCVFQNRLNTTMKLLKHAVDAGRFGKIYAINSTVIWKRGQDYYNSNPWRGTHALDGGAFMNQGIHFVDAMRFLCGEVAEVKSMLATLDRDMEAEDCGSALFRFQNGSLGNVFVTMLGQKDQEGSITVLGEKGTVRIGGTAMNRIEQWEFAEEDTEQDALARDADYHTQSVYGYGHRTFYRQVVDFLKGNGPRPTGGKDGIGSVELIRRIYASAS